MANVDESAKAAAGKAPDKASDKAPEPKKKNPNIVILRNDSNHLLIFPRIVGYDPRQVARGATIELDKKEFEAREASLRVLMEHERLVVV